MATPMPYCEPIAEMILARISAGEDLTAISKDGDMPSLPTIYKWLHSTPSFAEAYAHAREVQAEGLAARAQQIAERTHLQLPNGMFVPADPQRDRLAVDTLKWRAAHLKPKTWGDKLALEHSGSVSFSDMSDEDMIERMRELLATGRVSLPDGWELDDDADEEEDHSDLA